MFCKKCGKRIPNDSEYCSYCGASGNGIVKKVESPTDKISAENGNILNKSTSAKLQKNKNNASGCLLLIVLFFITFLYLRGCGNTDSTNHNSGSKSTVSSKQTVDAETFKTQVTIAGKAFNDKFAGKSCIKSISARPAPGSGYGVIIRMDVNQDWMEIPKLEKKHLVSSLNSGMHSFLQSTSHAGTVATYVYYGDILCAKSYGSDVTIVE